jgi:hypothetical protein
MVIAPGMPVPGASVEGTSSQRAVRFLRHSERDGRIGFGSIASSGILQILDKGPPAGNLAASVLTSATRSVSGDTSCSARHSAQQTAARTGTSGQLKSAYIANSRMALSARVSPPARPRTVGSGFRTVNALRGTTALSERGGIVISECLDTQLCVASGSSHERDGNAGGGAMQRSKRASEVRSAQASRLVEAGASIGIDVHHVQRQVRSALQHGGKLVVEVGGILDSGK